MKKIILLLVLLIPINVFALADSAKSNILIEASTGKIITEKESDKELSVASMTKMMTLLIIMEKLNTKQINLTDKVTISENAASMGGSQVYLESGGVYDVETLLKSIAVASANDAAVAMAEYISGSTDEFVKLMNQKVNDLGLKHTSFKNVHGLDIEGHFSSAHDMAFIARELLMYEDILKYSSIYEDYITHPNGNSTWIVNTNKLINYYEGLDGLKTGFTNSSGYCITATAKRGGMRLISVVMGEENNKIRNQDTMELLNYGFSNYKLDKVIKNDDSLGDIKIKFGNKEKVKLRLVNEANNLVDKISKSEYKYELELNEVSAPIKVGDIVGKAKVYLEDVELNSYDLTIKEDINKANYFLFLKRNLLRFFKGM